MGQEDGGEQKPILDPVIFRARRKMEALGKNPDFGQALINAESAEEVTQSAIDLGIPGDGEQIIGIAYRAFAQEDVSFGAAVEANLLQSIQGLEIPTELPAWFLANATSLPGYQLRKGWGDRINKETRQEFIAIALSVMLKAVQERLRE